MRWPINFSLVALLALAVLPLPAGALQVMFCSPACDGPEADPTPTTFGPGIPVTDATGVTTNSISLGTFTHTRGAKSFLVTATATAQQSATLQKITFNPTSITAVSGSVCSVTDPCKLEIVATSDPADFPAPKLVGGYPAGAFMMGAFTGPQGAITGTGDTISTTSEATGLNAAGAPVNTDVVNATPGTGPANVGTSLPSACTGTPGCKFVANALRKAFSTQISETVQQQCGVGETSCLTRLRTKVNIELKTPGNRVTLPFDWVTTNHDPQKPEKNPTEELVTSTLASVGTFEVNSLAVGPQHFLMKATMALGANTSIDPSTEEVYARVGTFSLTILPGQFKRQQDGKLYNFNGKIEGRQVNATFARDKRNASLWEVTLGVYQLELTGLPLPPLQVLVEIGVGNETGKDLVTARFFGNPHK